MTPTAPECRVHSIETFGTVDGPGVRVVIFFQGCKLRCLYCHNPDTRPLIGGTVRSTDDLKEEIDRYRSYMEASGGGVTFTGGEPLLQPEAIADIARWCREEGIHTALDTSGFPFREDSKAVLEAIDLVDLVLLDIKSFDPEVYHRVTGVDLAPTLAMARYLAAHKKPVWLRYVLVPGYTDQLESIRRLAKFAAELGIVERVQVLPFHKMGEYKWAQMGYKYELSAVEPPSAELTHNVRGLFAGEGLRVEG